MEIIKFKNKDFEIVEKFKNNKIHVKKKNKDFVIIPFNNYLNFSTYLSNKKTLKKNRVEISKLINKDKKGLMILEKFIDGKNLIEVIADNDINKYYQELFRVYRNNRFAKIALNYKPENFVLKGKYFYYVSDDIKSYNQVNSFERSPDILLWMNTKECKDYVTRKGYTFKDRNILKPGAELNKAIALLCVSNW